MPEAVPCLRIESLQALEDVAHVLPSRCLFIGAWGLLLLETLLSSYLCYPGLLDETEGTDELQGIVFHGHLGTDGAGMALEGEVHEPGREDVILVMTEGYLVETMFRGKGEEEFAAVPGTEEAAWLACVGPFLEATVQQVKPDTQFSTELLKVSAGGLVRDVVHDDMGGLHGDVGLQQAAALCHEAAELQ